MLKTVVVLTKSSKNKGYCVAGIDTYNGQWVRFVSDNEASHGALSFEDIRYSNGDVCKPLDVVEVKVKQHLPLMFQPENYLIDSSSCWKKRNEWRIYDVIQIHPDEIAPYLYGSLDPYVNEDGIRQIGYSLTLIKVSQLMINQTINRDGQLKTKASFLYNVKQYRTYAVTDPRYYSVPDSTVCERAYLVVSLPDQPKPENCYYKFIAQIFPS